MTYFLRDYQEQAVEAMLFDKNNDNRSVVHIFQGGGKSLVIANFAYRTREKVLILQPSTIILKQNKKKLEQYVDASEIGVYSASLGSKEIKTFTFATIQSVYKKPDQFKDFKYIVIDECHMLPPKGAYATFFKTLSAKIYGFSATPWRIETKTTYNHKTRSITSEGYISVLRSGFFNNILFSINTDDGIKGGYLTPLRYQSKDYFELNYKVPSDKKLVSQMTFRFGSVIPYITQIPTLIENATRTLIFVPNIAQADFIAEMYPEIESVHSKMNQKQRDAVMDRFHSAETKTLVSIDTLTTGFDEPLIDQIILLRPTKSHALLLQMLGRGMRLSENKKVCHVFDAVGAIKYLGRPDEWRVEKDPFDWNVWATIAGKKAYIHDRQVSYFEKDL